MATRAADRTLFGEVGVSGNRGYWGWPDSGEHVRSLEGRLGRLEYDKMRRSDHQVRAVLSAITLPIRQADFYIEPGSKSTEDIKIAKVIENALLREMSVTWDDTIRHALLMLPFGFSPLEKVYGIRNGLILPEKLDPRLPRSVSRWEYGKGSRTLANMVQLDNQGAEIPIPIRKLVIFSTDREGDNWEGMSILRPAYKSWYIKDKLERINGIMHDRWGAGVPSMTPPKGVERGSAEWLAAVELLEQFYAGEKAYMIKPEGWVFEVIGGQKGQGTDVLASIKYYDESIAKAMLAMHINLGTAEKGSRALGASFIDAFLMATQAWADYIAEVIDRFVVREIVDLNWTVQEYPHLKVRRIPGLNLDALGFLAQSGIIKHDKELENSLRDVLRLPHGEENPIVSGEGADDDPTAAVRDQIEAYGVGVRSGSITPQTDDEDHFRGIAGLPAMSEAVRRAWERDGGVRRPVTLTQDEAEGAPAAAVEDGDEEAATELAAIARAQAQAVAEQIGRGVKANNLTVPRKAEMFSLLRARCGEQPADLAGVVDEEVTVLVKRACDGMALALVDEAVKLRRSGTAQAEIASRLKGPVEAFASARLWAPVVRKARQAAAAGIVEQGVSA